MKAIEILNKVFSYDSFRPGQEQIINSIIDGRDTLAVLPTGAGKSLCFQIPAIAFSGLTVVVSPLIALMKDQVDRLNSIGVPSKFINSSLSAYEIENTYREILSGNIKLLYLAPERINSKRFVDLLKSVEVSQIAVDEAHCISEWGHDFRPSYREIRLLGDILPDAVVSAFTATATTEVKGDISKSLKLRSPSIFHKSFDRKNLSYKTEKSKDKVKRIKEILKDLKGSAMIYCGSRRRVENTYNELKKKFKSIGFYHAGLPENFRKQEQEAFLNDEKKIIIATSAFGMGIDKPNVRYVIHTDMTSTIESYYQEAGRAGRDGLNSECIILFDEADRGLQDFFIKSNYPDLTKIMNVYNLLYDMSGTKVGEFPNKIITEDYNKIAVKLNLDSKEIKSILRFLERENVIKLGNQPTDLRIKIIAEDERVREFYENANSNDRIVLEAILRSIPQSRFGDYQSLNLKKISKDFNIQLDLIEKSIKMLSFSGIIASNIEKKNGIHLLLARTEKSEYPFDAKHFVLKLESLNYKLNQVEEYIKTNSCKRNFILNYFDEKVKENCGQCSYCLGERMEQTGYKEQFIIESIRSAFNNLNSSKKILIRDFLKGSKKKELINSGYDTINGFGELKNVSSDEFDSAWQKAVRVISSQSNYEYWLASGLSFREISQRYKIKPVKLAKDLANEDLTLKNLESLFNLTDLEKISVALENNPKIDSRMLQSDLELDLTFPEIKLIISVLKKIS